MNIFWIVTDSICNYERPDLHGLLPIYKKLRDDNEGFYFENALAQFPSTVLSIFSFFTGRFPYYIFSDFTKLTKSLPSLQKKNLIIQLRNSGYRIQSILFWREGVNFLKEILNPYYDKKIFKGDHWLNAKEIYQIFLKKMQIFSSKEDNFMFIFFRPSAPYTNNYLIKLINYLKDNDLWKDSIFILNSDHGYYDKNRYKKIKLLHFDDLHQSSLQAAMYIKIPQSLTNTLPRTIKKRVYLLDIMETILDYLSIEPKYERESISFRNLIEKDINVNQNRKVRADCYLVFQSIVKAMIIKNNWKLYINNGKFFLYNLESDFLEKIDLKKFNPHIFNELYQFYLKTQLKANKTFISNLHEAYNLSTLSILESEEILIPNQFPPQLISYIKDKLKNKNILINPSKIKKQSVSKKKKRFITILIYNRLTGYGINRLKKKYQKYTKKFIFLDTALTDASDKAEEAGYLKFVLKSIISRRNQLFQRWKEILVWILYFPLYFNKYIRKYYT